MLPEWTLSHAVLVLSRLEPVVCDAVLSHCEPGFAREVREMMTYPAGSAGSRMDPSVHTFPPEFPVRAAIDRLRQGPPRRTYDVYLVDADDRLAGVVRMEDMVTVRDDSRPMGDISRAPAAFVRAVAGMEEVAELLDKHNLTTLPVLDADGRLLGVIRHRTLVDALGEEASADIQSMVGASKDERALSPVSFAVKKRLPWLQINLATAFVAASVVGLFEDTIARFTALAVLLPVVAGQSGNTGSQALAVTLRGLALREVRMSQWVKVAFKEAGVGLFNGIAVAAVTCAGVFIWSRSAGLTMVIGVAMVISMVIAGVTGAVIPMILSSLGQDPAQSSSIVLTTVTDVMGFFSFLGLATLFANLL
jgi:magnesium transporter